MLVRVLKHQARNFNLLRGIVTARLNWSTNLSRAVASGVDHTDSPTANITVAVVVVVGVKVVVEVDVVVTVVI